MSDDIREQLAAYAHEAWAGWMQYLFEKCYTVARDDGGPDRVCIQLASVERWKRQMQTKYADLPESEKASDREEADKMLSIIGVYDGG